MEHTFTDLKDKHTLRASQQYGSHRVDRSVPIGAFGSKHTSSTGTRQAVFLDTIPVQAAPQPPQKFRHGAPRAASTTAASATAKRPSAQTGARTQAQAPPQFMQPPQFNRPGAVGGVSGSGTATGTAGGLSASAGADSLQSIRDQLLLTLQQAQQKR